MSRADARPSPDEFAWEGSSCPLAVRHALTALKQRAAGWALPGDSLDVVEIVLAEALNNVMEHACQHCDGIAFSLQAKRMSHVMCCTIRDQGQAMPGLDLSATRKCRKRGPELNVAQADLPEGGFGWFLIYQLASGVRYRREGRENVLTLEIPLSE